MKSDRSAQISGFLKSAQILTTVFKMVFFILSCIFWIFLHYRIKLRLNEKNIFFILLGIIAVFVFSTGTN